MYRQTLKLEVANVKFSTALVKRKLRFFRTSYRVLGAAAPLAGFFLSRKKSRRKQEAGFFSRMLSGLKVLGQFKPLLSGFQWSRRQEYERENISRVQ
jgi:hypothetical protein